MDSRAISLHVAHIPELSGSYVKHWVRMRSHCCCFHVIEFGGTSVLRGMHFFTALVLFGILVAQDTPIELTGTLITPNGTHGAF
jgi:hypothetical protein